MRIIDDYVRCGGWWWKCLYAIGRRAVIVYELAGYGFNRDADWLVIDLTVSRMARLLPCYGGAMIMAMYNCIYAVE